MAAQEAVSSDGLSRTSTWSSSAGDTHDDFSDLTIRPALRQDVLDLGRLHEEDYVEVHRDMHRRMFQGALPRHSASMDDWKEALGPIDFEDVLTDLVRLGDKSEVRVLICVDEACEESVVVGYILFELRQKGRGKARQRYCEVVNVVVAKGHRGRGAGRLLFEAMLSDLSRTAPAFSADVRLFVAQENEVPMNWYTRLGFKTGGMQSEKIAGVGVPFVRMIRRLA